MSSANPDNSCPNASASHPDSRRLKRLSELTSILLESMDSSTILNKALPRAIDLFEGDRGIIFFLQGNSLRCLASRGIDSELEEKLRDAHLNLGEGIIGDVASTSDVHITKVPGCCNGGQPESVFLDGMKQGLFIPLRGKEQSFGVLGIGFERDDVLHAQDLEFFASVGRQIGQAAENARLFEVVEKSRSKFRQLVDTANAIILKLDHTGCFSQFNDTAERLTGYRREQLIG
ncbi:MAG: GAF domain-containing protein, partial [Planctomycetota bacterium]|nr:GAF domain-containing protein [Planctomycetota bacterium]